MALWCSASLQIWTYGNTNRMCLISKEINKSKSKSSKLLIIGHLMSSELLVLTRINSVSLPPNGNAMSAIDTRSFNIFMKVCVWRTLTPQSGRYILFLSFDTTSMETHWIAINELMYFILNYLRLYFIQHQLANGIRPMKETNQNIFSFW